MATMKDILDGINAQLTGIASDVASEATDLTAITGLIQQLKDNQQNPADVALAQSILDGITGVKTNLDGIEGSLKTVGTAVTPPPPPPPPPVDPNIPVVTADSVTAKLGVAFSYQITATNTPTSFGASGLPSGLSVDPATGLIAGTITSVTDSFVTMSATNASGTGTATLEINASF